MTATDDSANESPYSSEIIAVVDTTNQAPVGTPLFVNTDEGQALELTLSYTDPDDGSGPYTVAIG